MSRINSNETYIICFVPSRLAVISKISLLEGNVASSHISKFSLFFELRQYFNCETRLFCVKIMQIHALDRAKMLLKSYYVLRSSQLREEEKRRRRAIKPLKASD